MSGLNNLRQRHDDALSRVGWDHFESLLAVYFRGQGYEVGQSVADGADSNTGLQLHPDVAGASSGTHSRAVSRTDRCTFGHLHRPLHEFDPTDRSHGRGAPRTHT